MEHDTSQHSPNGSNGVALVTVSDASDILGITPSAVRKRINRGRLPAQKLDGQWHVALDEEQLLKASATEPANLVAARQQLEAIRDEWLQPFMIRIASQAEHVGRLEERIHHLERERNQLIAERNQLRAFLESQRDQPARAGVSQTRSERVTVAGLHLTDQVALAGIGLTLGLWVVLGLLAWWMVG